MFGIHSTTDLMWRLMLMVPLILSLSVHEWAHAYSAWLLGDDTASRQGRLTLNPAAHADPLGTILCPLLGIPFGWAKPVPVNPLRFRREVTMRTGMMITAAAGPLSNLAIAIACAVLYGLLIRFGMLHVSAGGLRELLIRTIEMNVLLCLFNFLPVPPLDGSRVVDGLLPYRLRPVWEQFTRFASIALLAVIFLGGSLLATPVGLVEGQLVRLIDVVAGR